MQVSVALVAVLVKHYGQDLSIKSVIENGFSCTIHSLITQRPLIMHERRHTFVHYSTAVS